MTKQWLFSVRNGVTLAELIVVVAVLGVISGIAVQTLPRVVTARKSDTVGTSTLVMLARAQALRTKRPVIFAIHDSTRTRSATALPDGSVIGERSALTQARIERLTGVTTDAVSATLRGKE